MTVIELNIGYIAMLKNRMYETRIFSHKDTKSIINPNFLSKIISLVV